MWTALTAAAISLCASAAQYAQYPPKMPSPGKGPSTAPAATRPDVPVLPVPRPLPPNILLDISSDMINAFVRQSVERTEPVREYMLDTKVTGMSQTKGEVYAKLIPDDCHSSIDIIFRGITRSSTVGVEEGIYAYTVTTIPFETRKSVRIKGGNIGTLPARTCSQATNKLLRMTDFRGETDTTFTGFAQRQYWEDKREIEFITSRRHEHRTTSSFEKETTPNLERAHKALRGAVDKLAVVGLIGERLQFTTTEEHLGIRGAVLTFGQGGSAEDAPELAGLFDLSLRLHQSFVGGASQAAIGGETLSLDQVGGVAEQLLGIFLKRTQTDPALKTPLKSITGILKDFGLSAPKITFARIQPISATIANHGFQLVVHCSDYRSGDKTYQGFKVTANYKIENWKGKVGANRVGPLSVTRVGDEKGDRRLPDLDMAFLNVSFSTILTDRLELVDMPLPPPLNEAGTLVPHVAAGRGGWLVVTWRRVPAGVYPD
jgi:hypothetical protein